MCDLLLEYEYDFFSSKFCSDIANLEKRIHLDFVEYGRSGNVHTRKEIIEFLLNMKSDRDIDIIKFSKTELCENVSVLHYISYEKLSDRYTRRTSIWKKEDNDWMLFFHQGTPCEQSL